MRYYSEDIVKKLIGYAEYNGTFGIHESLHIETYPSIEVPDNHIKDQYTVAKLLNEIFEYSRDLNRVSREVVKTDADAGTYLYHIGQEIDDALMTLELVLGIDVNELLEKGMTENSSEHDKNIEMRDLEESLDN